MGDTHSLAYRKNVEAIRRGEVPEKYLRIVPHVTGQRVLEVGSAEGVLALLLAREGKRVTALEGKPERHRAAGELAAEWNKVKPLRPKPRFINGKIGDQLQLLNSVDTFLAVRTIYYFREELETIFAAVAAKVPQVVLCGNKGRAVAYHQGQPHEPLGEWNLYASAEGMRALLERHGYSIVTDIREGDPIVVGERA